MKKKLLAITTALIMAVTIIPTTAFAGATDIVYRYNGGVVAEEPIKEGLSVKEKERLVKEYLPTGYEIDTNFKTDYTKSPVYVQVDRTVKPVKNVAVRLSTSSGGYDDAYLTWDKDNHATGYRVYNRRPSRSSNWSYIGRTTRTSYLKKNLYDGYKYEFRVIPYISDTDGNEIYRVYDNYKKPYVYTLKKVSTPSVYRSGSKVKVKWSNISGESGYQISRSTSKTGTYIVSTYSTSSGTYRYVTASKGRTYYYKVRAYKNVTKSGKTYRVYAPWSNVKSYRR